ncbi:MAG: stage II sporulation protein M [Nanoarchaeota archaeon]
MVFEQIFGARWLEKKSGITFLLGFIYAELGIISAILIFPEDPSLISIGFISLLILPSLNQLLSMETNQNLREKKLSLRLLFKDHSDILKVYACLFLGILLAYGLFALLLPNQNTEKLFSTQLDMYYQNRGEAKTAVVGSAFGMFNTACSGKSCEFFSILLNNLKVVLVCLIFSLVYGAGSILFLTWNASVWGTIFGYVTKKSQYIIYNLYYFTTTMISVFPHMITEAMSYLMAVFAGGIISKAVIREKFDSKKFDHVLLDGVIIFGLAILLLFVAAWLEVYLFPIINIG